MGRRGLGWWCLGRCRWLLTPIQAKCTSLLSGWGRRDQKNSDESVRIAPHECGVARSKFICVQYPNDSDSRSLWVIVVVSSPASN